MDRPHLPLPAPHPLELPEALQPLRIAALESLVTTLNHHLTTAPLPHPTALEDFSLRHLAKGTATARSALLLMRAQAWPDACILIRAVFEQLFTYLWVVQDPARAEARGAMITIKQEWANAKYLEGLAKNAEPAAQVELLAEARKYKEVAGSLLARLAAELGTTEKKVRDEATLRVSAKAIEVNLGPHFSVPYARYSGFAHSDGNALAAYGARTPEGTVYGVTGALPPELPLAGDLHHALLRLAEEVRGRCPRLQGPEADGFFRAQAAWLAEAERDGPAGSAQPLP